MKSLSTPRHALQCFLSGMLVLAAGSFVSLGLLRGAARVPLPLSSPAGPLVLALLLLAALLALAFLESGQVAVVNMSTIDDRQSKQLETSHPNAYAVYQNIRGLGVVERYLMGRQLCVIATVFFISQLTTFPSMPPLFPSRDFLQHALIDSGLPGVMITLTIGQLFPQLIADEYTIRFLNIKGSLFFIKAAERLEEIGIFTNCSWVVSYLLSKYVLEWSSDDGHEGDIENPVDNIDVGASTHNLLIKLRESYLPARNDMSERSSTSTVSSSQDEAAVSSNSSRYNEYNTTSMSGGEECSNATALSLEKMNPSKSGLVVSSSTFLKLICSTAITTTAATIVIYGVFWQKPLLHFHPLALLWILAICMISEFYLEGLQVAVLATQHRDRSAIPASFPRALAVHHMITQDRKDGIVKQFLIGRQFLVVLSMFTMASITSYESISHFDQAFLPRSFVSAFVITGFCGVIFALNTVQLPAQILAKQYPLHFLNLPGGMLFIKVTLLIESTGIMHFGWILFYMTRGYFQIE